MKNFISKIGMAIAALVFTGSVFANISVFNRSLPNQAGMDFDYVVDTWDYNTVAAYYSQSKADNFSMTYGVTELDGTDDAGEAALSGRLSIGLPLFYAVGFRNSGTFKSDNTVGQNFEASKKNSRTTAQLGTTFGTFGVALFTDLNKMGNEYKNSTSGTAWTTAGYSLTETNNLTKIGVNMGEASEDFSRAWTLGVAYTDIKDNSKQKDTAGEDTYVKGTDLDGDGTDDAIGDGYALDVATTGWLPVNGPDYVGWSGTFTYADSAWKQVDGGASATFYDGAATEGSATGYKYTVNPFYTKTLEIKEKSYFYLNPGVSVEGSAYKKEIKGATDKTEGSFTGVYFTIPIMFQVPVTDSGNFTLQAGVSPKVALYTTGDKIKTGPVETVEKTAAQSSFGMASLSYGLGASYKPSERLSMHVLFNTTANQVDSKFALGVDYHFASSTASEETTPAVKDTETQPSSDKKAVKPVKKQ